jgi:hypothetical protein
LETALPSLESRGGARSSALFYWRVLRWILEERFEFLRRSSFPLLDARRETPSAGGHLQRGRDGLGICDWRILQWALARRRECNDLRRERGRLRVGIGRHVSIAVRFPWGKEEDLLDLCLGHAHVGAISFDPEGVDVLRFAAFVVESDLLWLERLEGAWDRREMLLGPTGPRGAGCRLYARLRSDRLHREQRLLQRFPCGPQSLDGARPGELGLELLASPLDRPVGQLQPHPLSQGEQALVHRRRKLPRALEDLLGKRSLLLAFLGHAQHLLPVLVGPQVLEQLEAHRWLRRRFAQQLVQTLLQRDRQQAAPVSLEVLVKRGEQLLLVILRRGRRVHRPLRGTKEIREELPDPDGGSAWISMSSEHGAEQRKLLEGR